MVFPQSAIPQPQVMSGRPESPPGPRKRLFHREAMREILGVPEEAGDYEIGERLGRGGMAEVRAGIQLATGRPVVLKSLLFSGAEDGPEMEEMRQRLRREGELLERLGRHPGLPEFGEVAEIGGRTCLVMERIDGVPLSEFLGEHPQLSEQDKIRLMERIARSVAHAHALDVTHRDLKPANVLVEADGNPVVVDFGIGARTDTTGSSISGLTREGMTVGTPHWMAPEQARGNCVVPAKADVHALGLLLFYVLTGELPILPGSDESEQAYLRRVADEPPRLLKLVNPTLRRAQDLSALCRQALNKDPAKRPGAEALARELSRWLHDEPMESREPGRLEKLRLNYRRNRHAWVLTAVASSLVLGFLIWGLLTENHARKVAESALSLSNKTQSVSDLMIAAESLVQDASQEAMPWLDRSIRRDPENQRAVWLAGQTLMQDQELAPSLTFPADGLPWLPHHHSRRYGTVGDGFFYIGKQDRTLRRCTLANSGQSVLSQPWPDPTGPAARLDGFNIPPDGSRIVVVETSGAVKLFETATDRLLWRRECAAGDLKIPSFSTSGKRLLLRTSALPDGMDPSNPDSDGLRTTTFRILETESGNPVRPDLILPGMYDLCVIVDDTWLLTRRNFSDIILRIHLQTGETSDLGPEWKKILDGTCYSMLPVPGTAQVVLAGQGRSYRAGLLDVAAGRLVWNEPLTPEAAGYTVLVKDAAISADGRHAALVSLNGDLFVLRTSDGKPPYPTVHTAVKPRGVDIEGNHIVLETESGVRLIDLLTGRQLARSGVQDLWPWGEHGFLLPGEKEWQYWQLKGRRAQERELSLGTGKTGFEISRDGKRVLASCQDGGIALVNLDTMTARESLWPRQPPDLKAATARRMVPSPRLSADGRTAVDWESPLRLAVWHLPETGTPEKRQSIGVDSVIRCAAISGDGSQLVFALADAVWEAWDVSTGQRQLRSELLCHPPEADDSRTEPGLANNMTFSPEMDRLAIGTEQWCTDSVWRTSGWQVLQPPVMSGHGVSTQCFQPGKNGGVWSGNWEGTCRFLEMGQVYTKKDVEAFRIPQVSQSGPLTTCAVSPDGQWLATASMDGMAAVWETRTRAPVPPALVHQGKVTSVDWSPDSQRLLTATTGGEVLIWDRLTARRLASFPQPCAVIQASFALNGQRLAIARMDGKVIFLELYPFGQPAADLTKQLRRRTGRWLDDTGTLRPAPGPEGY